MIVALYIVSILWIASGAFLIIYTEGTRGVLKKIFPVERVKWLAVLPIVIGIILVLGAFFSREVFWLMMILGLLAIVKGVYLFAGPSKQVKALFEWWFDRAAETTVRFYGLVAYTLGCAILSYLH